MSSIDKKRKKLIHKSTSFKDALSKNIVDIKSGSADVGNFALIGGAVLLGGYLLYKMISSPEEVDQEMKEKMVVIHQPKNDSFIIRSIKQSIATFLLAIAKQKLLEYLDNKNEEIVE